jgi:hypothetical protein
MPIRPRSLIVSLLLPIALLAGWPGTDAARADSKEDVRIDEVLLGWNDSLLVCTVGTEGLPTPPARETLESGLPSSLVFALTLLRVDGGEISTTIAEVLIEPDLWEGILRVHAPLFDTRAGTIDEVAATLRNVGPLPVLRLSDLGGERLVRLRVRLAIHALAPGEIERMHALFTGSAPMEDPDRREISVGVGVLIRRFLGRDSRETWSAESISPPFDPRSPGWGRE